MPARDSTAATTAAVVAASFGVPVVTMTNPGERWWTTAGPEGGQLVPLGGLWVLAVAPLYHQQLMLHQFPSRAQRLERRR